MGIFQSISSSVYVLLAFVTGLCTALWKLFSAMERVSVLEYKTAALEAAVDESKRDLRRLEDRLIEKLEGIDSKLDGFIKEVLTRK